MNLTMIKVLRGLIDDTCLLRLLDMAKKTAQSDTTKLDESDDSISNKDSKIDEEKIDVNEEEIRHIYVSLIV